MYGRIYKIINVLNNKIYIGKTTKSIEERFKDHIKESMLEVNNSHLHAAIKKYTPENFKIEEIDFADSLYELNEKEKYWIKFYSSQDINIGYNIAKGGDGGDIFNQLSKEKQEEKRNKHSLDTSNRIWITNGIDTMYINKDAIIPEGFYPGRTFNTSNIGKYKRTEEHIKIYKDRPKRTGFHHSDETKQKLRDANLGKKYSTEINKKKGRPKSGALNPAFGVHYKWLTNGIEDIRLYEDKYYELDSFLSNGYRIGRSNKSLFGNNKVRDENNA